MGQDGNLRADCQSALGRVNNPLQDDILPHTNFGFRLAYQFPETALSCGGAPQEAFQLDSFAGAKFQ